MGCVHGMRNVPGMINLTELVRGRSIRNLRLYILHLMEFSERSSAILMVQRARRDCRPFFQAEGQARTDNVVVAFEAFERLSKVVVRPMTVISGYDNMHEDICSTAEDKRVAMIIVPFHRNLAEAGAVGNTDFRSVNRKVLQHAPCSVGILIDRGVGGAAQISPSSVSHNSLVLFFGGPDDGEALAFGLQMAQHPGVSLKVIRFVSGMADGIHKDQHSYFSSPSTPSHVDGSRQSSTKSGVFGYLDMVESEAEIQRALDEAALDAIRVPKVEAIEEDLKYEEVPISISLKASWHCPYPRRPT